MKKLLLILAVMISTLTMYARDSYSHDVDALPAAAKTAIKENFKSTVSLVKIDKELGRIHEYEVILTDGSEITFDREGTWKDVEVRKTSQVPAAFIPNTVSEYVQKSHPGNKIIGIEKNRKGFEIELSNGVDIQFDKSGTFLKYED